MISKVVRQLYCSTAESLVSCLLDCVGFYGKQKIQQPHEAATRSEELHLEIESVRSYPSPSLVSSGGV